VPVIRLTIGRRVFFFFFFLEKFFFFFFFKKLINNHQNEKRRKNECTVQTPEQAANREHWNDAQCAQTCSTMSVPIPLLSPPSSTRSVRRPLFSSRWRLKGKDGDEQAWIMMTGEMRQVRPQHGNATQRWRGGRDNVR